MIFLKPFQIENMAGILPFGAAHTYIAYTREYLPGVLSLMKYLQQCHRSHTMLENICEVALRENGPYPKHKHRKAQNLRLQCRRCDYPYGRQGGFAQYL